MYIRFVLYTCMLHILRQTYFDMPIHVFGVLCFKQNIFLDFKSKTVIYIYIFHVYWIISICNMLQIVSMSCFFIWMSFGQNDFPFEKNLSFGKYGFWFSAKFVSHKNGSNSLKYVFKFFSHACISMYYTETIFLDF